jgi:hypothetical protein
MADIDLELVTPSALEATDVAIVRRGSDPYTAELVSLAGFIQGAGGSAVLDFGAAPGTNVATVTVSTSVPTAARIKVWFQGDSTADHNAYEHAILLPMMVSLSGGEIIDGVSFVITAATELRLTGDVACRWEWSV